MPDGFSLNVDPKFLQDLEKAEQKLKDIAETSDKTSKAIIKNFQEATDKGIGYFLSQMRKANEQLLSFSNASKSMKIGDVSGLSSMNKMASQSTDIINKLIDALVKLSSEQSKSKSSSSKDSDVSKINSLYRERIKLMKQLEHFAQLGAKGVTLTNEESSSISSIHQRLQVIDMEIKSYQKRTDLSKQAIRSLIQGEADFSIAQGNEIRKRQKLVEDENRKKEDKVRQEALHNEKLASLDKKRAEDIVKQQQKELNDYRAYLKSKQDMYKRMFDQIAKQESQMRSKSYNRFQASGDTSNQATAAYNRLYGEHGIKSVNNMNRALQRLQDAQNKLNLNTDKGRQKYDELGKKIQQIKKDLDKATQANEKFHNSHSKLLNTTDQLQRKLALIFSVSQIVGYMNKLVNVRKEFELQRKSLEVLLQSKNQADKLWQQTMDLAIKSPFRVKELVTYTRQLAAYRIETDKLHETTRRLSDVSSGLGVDMQRLILAYGQVRAAGFLRGTELRQFTEAGIPMLDELAKYLTEIEGTSVGVGEVFERISKRMISFKDVSEVFHRMTDAGGAFYKMQEEQSKTLSGMISNLHDSIDLMLNDIGQSNEWVLKGFINFAREFVESWELVAEAMKAAAAGMVLYKLNVLLASDSLKLLAIDMGILTTSIPKQLTIIQLLKMGWVSLSKSISATRKSLVAFVANNPLITFGALAASVLGKLAFTLWEHNKAINEISENYDKMRQKMESIKFDFNSAQSENDIKKLRKSLIDIIGVADRDYGINFKVNVEDLNEQQLISKFNEISQKLFDSNIFTEGFQKAFQRATEWVVTDDVFEDLKELGTTASDVFEKAYNKRFIIVNRLKESESELNEEERKALSILSKRKSDFKTELEFLENLRNGYDVLSKSLGGYYGLYEKFGVTIDGLDTNFTTFTKNINEAKEEYLEVLKTINLEGLTDEEKTLRLTTAINTLASQQNWNQFVRDYIYKWTEEEVKVKIGFEESDADGGLLAWQYLYNEKFEGYKGFKKIEDSATKQSDIIERLNAQLKTTEELYNRMKQAGEGAYSNYQLQNVENEIADLKEMRLWFGESDKTKGKDWMSEVVKGIKEAHQEYIKLNKTLGDSEAKQLALNKYAKSFAESAKNAGLKDISLGQFKFETEEGAIEALTFLKNKLPQSAKQARFKLEEAIGEIRGEVRIRTKAEDDKLLIEQIEDMFSGYEMSIELQKLNIPPDLAKQLFNIDTLTLPELKSKVVSMESQFVGTDMEEEYRKFLKKIDEMEEKAQMGRLEKYSKYLIKAQSERVKIKMEEMRQLAEIEKLGYTDTQKQQITQAIKVETQQKLDKEAWESFKNTDFYIQMFEDLGVVSGNVLNDLQKRLVKMRGSLSNLSPQELKEVVAQLERVTSEQISRNPFENLGDTIGKGVKALKRLKDEQNAYNDALKEQESTQSTIDSLQISIEEAKNKQKEAKATLESSIATKEQKEQAMAVLATSALEIVNNEKLLDVEIKRLAAQKGIAEEAAKKLILTRAEVSELNKTANSVGAWGSTITDSVSQVTSMLKNWGIDFGEEFEGVLSGLGQAFGALENIDLTKPMSVISGVTGVVSGLGNAFASIFGFGNKDNKKEKQIQREIKFVEDLQRAYQKLEKAIDNAYSINTLQVSGQATKKNIDAQIASYNKMIASEKDKKKTDKDRIKEWQLAVEDLIEQKAELDKELVSVATSGIMDDVLSASQEFTNAWLEAFNETGDGLSGLETNFKETMLEMVKQQAAMLISQSYIEKWKKQLEQYINPDDLELSTDEAKKWVDAVSNSLPQLNDALTRYFEAMKQAGVDLSGGGQNELSGLQRGIQSVTEETAQIIEAYLNSIRFFVAEQTTYLSQIASSFGNTEMENPMVEQLRIIASQTTAINTLLQSLTRGGHTLGGVGLKVFIS